MKPLLFLSAAALMLGAGTQLPAGTDREASAARILRARVTLAAAHAAVPPRAPRDRQTLAAGPAVPYQITTPRRGHTFRAAG